MKEHAKYRTWVEIDTDAIEDNTRTMKKLLSGKLLMSVVKSNAYGHGMTLSARAVLRGGADMLAVDDIDEALELRREGIKAPILVLGHIIPKRFSEAVMKNISITISSIDSLEEIMRQRFVRKPRVHIKFETGLYRQGISETDMNRLLSALTSRKWNAIVEGVYTHFAAMESPSEVEYSKGQVKRFETYVKMLHERGFEPLRHMSASSGILFSPEFHYDVARAGIVTYGLWPSSEIRNHAHGVVLKPALSWKTIVSEVKSVKRGERVGYDLTYKLTKDSRIAVIPVGYWHGLPRALSNTGLVLLHGKYAPIIGRVSMDMTIIDVTDIKSVIAGDTVILIGTDGKSSVSAEDMADKADTINYEIVTRINPLIERIEI